MVKHKNSPEKSHHSGTTHRHDTEMENDVEYVNQEFVESLGYYKGDIEKAKLYREDQLIRDTEK
jgi:hypothetical protein